MLAWLKSRRNRRQVARSLYGSSVTAARAPIFYAEWGVPDTLQGRFEMLALHVALVLGRLSRDGEPGRRLSFALTEAFVADLDDSMRELTFGDLAVPREIKRATAALFDRHAAYLAALAGTPDMSLSDVLAIQLAYLDRSAGLNPRRLSDYVERCAQALDAQPAAQFLAGRIQWPNPAACECPRATSR
jgi:cytochrome b pre-mRNA-processing protein 3